LTGSQIRQQFLDYFKSHAHRIIKSSSLLPANDPTLLFTNAGMNQFKDLFLGREKRDYSRATTAQKCVRAGGKHNDLENVGKTARHHTFFEMLGNFSFGDYFKDEAIFFAWNLVTKDYGITPSKLFVTIYRDDDQAFEIWNTKMNVPTDRIFRLGEKDNFWAMGDTGPCGPCSELHYDQGADASDWGHDNCSFPCDCGRYVEIWNLVFMQFNRDASGQLTPLPKPSIDTGMGLERIAAVLQGKKSNFETDLLKPLILNAAEIAGKDYGEEISADVSMRVIADHARASAFLIGDGIVPSNEGRGYVLRKIMRRAIRHGLLLGIEDPFLFQMTGFVAEHMKDAYPELLTTQDYVAKVVKNEELRFASTIRVAIDQLGDALERIKKGTPSQPVLPGDVMFKFYDTFGLPLDLMQEIAEEHRVTLDEKGFNEKLEAQRERGKASWKESAPGTVQSVQPPTPEKTQFLGYQTTSVDEARILAIYQEGKTVQQLTLGESGLIFLDKTPFYAETGGQVGDTGQIEGEDSKALVHNTTPLLPGFSAHDARCIHGRIQVGDIIKATVDLDRRQAIAKNHTATHLLHASLRNLIGFHVKQAGSLVAPDRLRFDFTHYAALSPSEISEIEDLVNATIMKNMSVSTTEKDLNAALSDGAMALFGEKYGDRVRVVTVGDFSLELCGGTHVNGTGEIGLFKIVGEGGIAAGIRRIEAVTGPGALDLFREDEELILELQDATRAPRQELPALLEKYQSNLKELEKEVETLKYQLARQRLEDIEKSAVLYNGIKILTGNVEKVDKGVLRNLADELKSKAGTAIIVLGTADEQKVSLVATMSPDLVKKLHAGKLIKEVAALVGGTGGGRPDMAEAGGKDSSKLPEALNAVVPLVSKMLRDS
jgi:alanyl-tRNA synthetase